MNNKEIMDCQYCKKMLSSSSNLIKHQKTAKYCLKLRNIVNEKYECKYCNKYYSTKNSLTLHHQQCSSRLNTILLELSSVKNDNKKLNELNIFNLQKNQKLENKIKKHDEDMKKIKEYYEKRIESLEDKLKDVAIQAVSKPTTTNNNHRTQIINNYISNMEPITQEHLDDCAKYLTIEHIKKGADGYAEYAMEYPLKDRILCVDYSRRKIKYKDDTGYVKTDPEMVSLTKRLFESIKARNKELIMKYVNELAPEMDDSTRFDIMCDMSNYMLRLSEGAEGEKSDFVDGFVKTTCSTCIPDAIPIIPL